MVRDREIQRLIRYAQGMGVSVRFKPYIRGSMNGGGWTVDGSEIVVYVSPGDSKVQQVLTLIHEIAHHKGFIENNRQTDPKVIEALEDEEEKKISRKRIFVDEVSDMQYWEQIYKDTGCTFDIRKMYFDKDFQAWSYETFYETGKFPMGEEKTNKKKELRKKYG